MDQEFIRVCPGVYLSRFLYTDGKRYFGIVRYNKDSYQLFYQSSGANTNGGWFPTDGLVVTLDDTEMYFSKLANTRFSLLFKKDVHPVMQKIIDLDIPGLRTNRDVREKLLLRIGCTDLLRVCIQLGSVFWQQHPELIDLFSREFGVRLPKRSATPYNVHNDKHVVRDLTDAECLNRFCATAISTNYLKKEYNENQINEWVDYNQWYDSAVRVAEDSPMNKTLRRLGATPSAEEKELWVTIRREKYIPEIFLHINLQEQNPNFVDSIKKIIMANVRRKQQKQDRGGDP